MSKVECRRTDSSNRDGHLGLCRAIRVTALCIVQIGQDSERSESIRSCISPTVKVKLTVPMSPVTVRGPCSNEVQVFTSVIILKEVVKKRITRASVPDILSASEQQ